MNRKTFKSAFIPRPAKLELELEGVAVIRVKLENEQARALSRAFQACKGATSPPLHDRDVVEAMIAALLFTAEELKGT